MASMVAVAPDTTSCVSPKARVTCRNQCNVENDNRSEMPDENSCHALPIRFQHTSFTALTTAPYLGGKACVDCIEDFPAPLPHGHLTNYMAMS